jgi:hypothetical protein
VLQSKCEGRALNSEIPIAGRRWWTTNDYAGDYMNRLGPSQNLHVWTVETPDRPRATLGVGKCIPEMIRREDLNGFVIRRYKLTPLSYAGFTLCEQF